MDRIYTAIIDTPIDKLKITAHINAILTLDFAGPDEEVISPATPLLKKCEAQLNEYFSGKRKSFKIPLAPSGTAFQMKVWNEMRRIPYGKTKSYRNIAASIDHHGAARAVGGASGKNRIAIIIPCHRVVGSDGTLTGFVGGLWRKEWLLKHEQKLK